MKSASDTLLHHAVSNKTVKHPRTNITLNLLEDEVSDLFNDIKDNEANVGMANRYGNKSTASRLPLSLKGERQASLLFNNLSSEESLGDNTFGKNILPILLETEGEFSLDGGIGVVNTQFLENSSGNSSEDYYIR